MGDWSYLIGAVVGIAGYWFGAWLYYWLQDHAFRSYKNAQTDEIVKRTLENRKP